MFQRKYNLTVYVLLIFSSFNLIASPLDATLLKQSYQLHQMWALSRNYYHGTTVNQNKIKALAWLYIYTSVLPNNYPGMRAWLQTYEKELSVEDRESAKEEAAFLKKKFQLAYRFNEKELFDTFALEHDTLRANGVIEKNTSAQHDFANLNDFIKTVRLTQPRLAHQYEEKIRVFREEEEMPIVYGQVVVDGAEPPENVSVNQLVDINEGGFFLHAGNLNTLLFQLNGYLPVSIPINTERGTINLSRILMRRVIEKDKASIVGTIRPLTIVDDIDIVLRLKNQSVRDEPWLMPVVPVTVLTEGQFYAEGLSPSAYELIISYKGKTKVQSVSLRAGAIKTIPEVNVSNWG